VVAGRLGVGPWGPLARPAQEHKGPANAAPSVPHHTRFSFACSPLTRFRFKFQSAPAAHLAPAIAPATHIAAAATTNPACASIHGRYPAIDPLYLKEILENRFQPENIIKLSTLFSPSPRRRETVTLGTLVIPTTERDRDSQDCRGGLPSLMQPFEFYGQILCHFAPPGARLELQQALADYRELLFTLNRTSTFESLQCFHFTFHSKRRSLGIFDPLVGKRKTPICSSTRSPAERTPPPPPHAVRSVSSTRPTTAEPVSLRATIPEVGFGQLAKLIEKIAQEIEDSGSEVCLFVRCIPLLYPFG
jgi:hypothetical protein